MSEWEWFRGEFATFAEARRHSKGYDDPAILARVLAATRLVADGRAAFERDGVAFERPFLNEPLIRALRTAAEAGDSRLRVLDFGGSLGSAYWQNRTFVAPEVELEWIVVEQPQFVEAGRAELEHDSLRFAADLREATRRGPPDLVLVSSALQYLESPWQTLDELLALAAPQFILDRIPLLLAGADRLTIEHVPPSLGATSYPAWFLSEPFLLASFSGSYELIERFASTLEDGSAETWQLFGEQVPNRGFRFRRRSGRAPNQARHGGARWSRLSL